MCKQLVTVCAKDHPRLTGESVSLDTFVAEGHAVVGSTNPGKGAVDVALAVIGKARRVQIATGHFLSLIRITATSDLVATVPRRLAEQAANELQVKILSVLSDLQPFDITMAWSARRHNDPAYQ